MTTLTEHQRRLWQEMVDLIQSYLNGESSDFYTMVGKLEGALDASEIKDSSIVNGWYDLWTPLETRRAIQGNDIEMDKAKIELLALMEFVANQIRT